MLRNDGDAAITGLANVSVETLQFWATAVVNVPARGQQKLIVYITEAQHLDRISPGTTRFAVTLAGQTQIADAVRWSAPPGLKYSADHVARIHPIDLDSAYNFDAEQLYSTHSMASRWRLDYTGAGIGIEAQLRYNNTARIHAQRPGHPIAIDNSAPYRGFYLDASPITNLGYGNLPEHTCHSGIGSAHCNNNPGLNTGLVPNGTIADGNCNVWKSTAGTWTLPPFTQWSDFNQPELATSLTFKTGQKGQRNILALISSQPFDAFSSSATLTLPASAVRPTRKLYLLTANLAKSLKCYTPHAEITFIYANNKRDVVSLTPPFSFSSMGGNAGFEAFVPAHYGVPFGTLNKCLGTSSGNKSL